MTQGGENSNCFVCGENNPIGLKLKFREENDKYLADFMPTTNYQGYDGVLHGGIVSTLIDEITAGYMYYKGYKAVTAKLEVRFRKPTPIGEKLTVQGEIISQKGKMVEMLGKIILADGSVSAEGKTMVALQD